MIVPRPPISQSVPYTALIEQARLQSGSTFCKLGDQCRPAYQAQKATSSPATDVSNELFQGRLANRKTIVGVPLALKWRCLALSGIANRLCGPHSNARFVPSASSSCVEPRPSSTEKTSS